MTQEEKFSLSSEEKEIIWELRNRFCSSLFGDPAILMGLIQRLRRITYRSGKLAGIKIAKEKVKEEYGCLCYNDSSAYIDGLLEDLIEEEKKKL